VWTNFTSGYAVPANSWTHIAVTRMGSVLRLFIGGVLCFTNSNFTDSPFVNTNPLRIGSSDGTQGFYSGYIADLKLTNMVPGI